MRIVTLLILLATMPGIYAREATLESNIVFFLGEAGLSDTIKLVGRSNNQDSVYAVPVKFDPEGVPTLLRTMENTPQNWQEVKSPLSLFDRFCHHGRWKSFRSTSTPSLHVIVFRESGPHHTYNYWFHIHFDNHVPSLTKPWGTVQHMSLEVIPKIIFGARPSQSRIEEQLHKRKT